MKARLDALDKRRLTTDITAEVEELQRLGVYPANTVEANPNSVLDMVKCWGAHWQTWREPLACPHCGADLRDHVYGPPFKREVGMCNEYRSLTHYQCPDCGGTWR